MNEIKTFTCKHEMPSCFDLHGYLTNNINNIDQKDYEDRGYFIVSCSIESANETVLQRRLKQAGMRRDPKTTLCILALVAKQLSGLWYLPIFYNYTPAYGTGRKALFFLGESELRYMIH
jgi:hypothetical protein